MLAPAPDADTPTPFDEAVTRLSAPAAEFAIKMPLFPLWVRTVSETNNELAPLGAKLIPQWLKLRIREDGQGQSRSELDPVSAGIAAVNIEPPQVDHVICAGVYGDSGAAGRQHPGNRPFA